MSSAREELVWVELRGEGNDDRSVNPEGVRVEEMERLFEVMQVDVMKYEEKRFDDVIGGGGGGGFNARIGLGAKITQIVMGRGCWI